MMQRHSDNWITRADRALRTAPARIRRAGGWCASVALVLAAVTAISAWTEVSNPAFAVNAAQDKSKDNDKKESAEKSPKKSEADDNDRGERRPPSPRSWQRRQLSEEQIKIAATILKDIEWPFYDRLERIQESDPEEYKRAIGRIWYSIEYLARTRERDPEHYQVLVADRKYTFQSYRLAHEYREAVRDKKEDKAKALLADLRKVAELQFDVRQKLRERELKDLEQRLVDLRRMLAERNEKRQELIDKQIKEMTERDRNERGERGDRDRDRGGDRGRDRNERGERERT